MKVSIHPLKSGNLRDVSARYARAIENAGNMSSKAVKVDFAVTVKTWKGQPEFTIDHSVSKPEWQIGTDNLIYHFVTGGTIEHPISAKNGKSLSFFRVGFMPKTKVGWLGSLKGKVAKKEPTAVKSVWHPGTEARKFVETIGDKWEKEWPRQLARALRAVDAFEH
jgi:hypothetical protein